MGDTINKKSTTTEPPLFATLMVILKEFFEKVNLEKYGRKQKP